MKIKLHYPKPTLVCSMCLGFTPVRYDGNIIYEDLVEKLKNYATFIPVCPEVEVGLGVPRNPLVLYKEGSELKLIDSTTGNELTSSVIGFVHSFLGSPIRVDGFILKAGSPTCGVGDAKIYGKGRRVIGKTNGVFTRTIKQMFPLIPLESEKRLANYSIRRDFLTRVFTIALVRDELNKAKSSEDVVTLHRGLKYLLMLYSPKILKNLGRAVARRRELPLEDLKSMYEKSVLLALSKTPSTGSYVSVLQHIYGHLKGELRDTERTYVVSLLERLYTGKESLKTVLVYFKGFTYRFDNPYLAEQRFLQPYPEELDEVP